MLVPEAIHIKPTSKSKNEWDVLVTYTFFGILPAPTKYLCAKLTRKQVEKLKVPFAKFCIYDKNTPYLQRY